MRSHRRALVAAAVVVAAAHAPLPNAFSFYHAVRNGEGPEVRRSGGTVHRPRAEKRGTAEAVASSKKAQAVKHAVGARGSRGQEGRSPRDHEAAIREFERTMKIIEQEHLQRAEVDLEEMYRLVERADS
mmetsp:Transcript_69382/g.203630  ORF Transcript_69382/g.203630 Transcript_69382/m.203630 type:complete len:129 (-) Transcript_69382:94-480(-)